MSDPVSYGHVDYIAFHLLRSYAEQQLAARGSDCQNETLFDLLVNCQKFDEKKDVLTEDGKIRHFIFLIDTGVSCQKYREALDYGRKIRSSPIRALSETEKELLDRPLLEASLECKEYREAIKYGEELLTLSSKELDDDSKSYILMRLGEAFDEIGKHSEATDYLEKSLAILSKLGNMLHVGVATIRLYLLYRNNSESKKAEECLQRYLEVSKQNVDKKHEAIACNRLGSLYFTFGQYKKAIVHHKRQLELAKSSNELELEGYAYSGLGCDYQQIGEEEKAKYYLEKALRVSKKIGNRIGQGKTYHNLGKVCQNLGQYQQALVYHEKALEISREYGDREMESSALSCLATGYSQIGESEKAIEYLESSLKIARASADIRQEGKSLLSLATVYMSVRRFEEASELCEKSVKISRQVKDSMLEIVACQCSGLTYFLLHQHDAQCKYLCQAISKRHSIREDFRNRDRFNMSMAKQDFAAHNMLLLGLLHLTHIKKALLVLDLGRSKALVDLLTLSSNYIRHSLSESQSIKWIEKIPDMLHDPTKDSHAEISENILSSLQGGSVVIFGFDILNERLFIWVLAPEKTFLRVWSPQRTSSSRIFFDNLSTKLKDAVTHRGLLLHLEDARDSVGKTNSQMLHELPEELRNVNPGAFSLSEELLNKVGRTNQQNAQAAVDEFETLEPEEETNDQTSSRGGDPQPKEMETKQCLSEAYQALIAPVEDVLTGTKLVIVPADSLFLLPFSALLDRDGKPLCDHYSIQLTSALHTLNFSLSIPMKPLGAAVCVGNPNVGRVSFQTRVIDIPPLTGAEAEATECAANFEGKPLLGKQATKKEVLQRIKTASVVHIAAHGNMNYGEIFLAPDPKAPSPPTEEHYLLMPEDVTKCSLAARLVVLGCCHSGRGKISSEGVAGTARAFLGAGARAVLVALWALPDKETREFMRLFYDSVCRGLSVCVALQKATKIFKERNDQMQAWAPFEIFGEDVTITSEDLEEIRRLSRERTGE